MIDVLAARLRRVLGDRRVISDRQELRTYECDGLAHYKVMPALVALPQDAGQVAAVVRACAEANVPFVARGSGTGLSGGALPHADGVLIVTSQMRSIRELAPEDERAIVDPGVINLAVSKAANPLGYYYAPDPSSQQICSIGGNVAENSGGAHCLKYGFTTNHVVGAQVVAPDGELVELGGRAPDTPGYDLLGAFVGSEGTLGITTAVTLKLTRLPESVRTLLAAFETTDQAGSATSAVIAAGVVPAAVEMMDALAIEAAEAAVACGYPDGAGAVLIVELDGPAAEVGAQFDDVERLCREAGAFEIRIAADDAERALFWKGRKSAFAAVGRISPDYIVQDGVIPRTALPAVLHRIGELSAAHGVRVANVFHAGDGNLHPLVLFDDAVEGQAERAEQVSGAIIDLCIEYGGSITGEHGVGMDKSKYMPKMYTDADLETMQLVRCAFDPAGLSNPGKIFPTPRLCGEVPGRHKATDAPPKAEIFWMKVLTPRSTEEAAELLRDAARDDLAVLIRGAGTKIDWAVPPERADIILDTTALTGVVEHAAGDLITIVRAGTPMSELDAALGGQQLALDPMLLGATVGGTVATNVSGPRRMLYGTTRDLLIGITVVRPDGTVAKAGGKVVKNVAGYDLGKLFTGSYGTLGLITECAFRLHPRPKAQAYVRATVDPGRAVPAVLAAQVVPAGLEIEVTAGGGVEMAVLVEGSEAGVRDRTATLVDLLGGESSDQPPDWWAAYPWRADQAGLKLTAPLSKVPDVLASAEGVAVRGSAGTGVLYAAVDGGDPVRALETIERLRVACVRAGGHAVVLTAPPAVRDITDMWGPVAGLNLMRRVKDQFDPGHRFAPGRFVGGI